MTRKDLCGYLAIAACFVVAGIAAAAAVAARGVRPLALSPQELILLALASYRLTRIAVLDEVARPARSLFFRIGPDGKETPKSSPTLRHFAELLSCTGCTGVWVTSGLVYLYLLTPGAALFVAVFALAGVQQLLDKAATHLTPAAHEPAERVTVSIPGGEVRLMGASPLVRRPLDSFAAPPARSYGDKPAPQPAETEGAKFARWARETVEHKARLRETFNLDPC